MVEAAQQRRQLLGAPAQRAQLRPRFLRDVQGPLHIEQRRTLGCLFTVRRVQHTAGRAPPLAHLRQDPVRRPALTEDFADHRRRRRRKRFGGDLVRSRRIDRPHVLGRPDPHPVLRSLHAAVQLVTGQYSEPALFHTRRGFWGLPGRQDMHVGVLQVGRCMTTAMSEGRYPTPDNGSFVPRAVRLAKTSATVHPAPL